MIEKKMRVLVFGSTFGQYYMQALKNLNGTFELAGLYASGSERSRKCAQTFGVSLYTDINELPPDIDAAAVVIRSEGVGGNGTEIARHLMERGIHVIQEQPIHPEFIRMGMLTSKKCGVHYQIADLYTQIEAVQQFITAAQYLNRIYSPLYVHASFSTQVAFPTVDILCRVMPSIRNLKVNHIEPAMGPFSVMTGKMAGIPLTFEYNNQINPADPDNNMHVLHKFAFTYPSGRLTLEDTFGPISWKPRFNVARDKGDEIPWEIIGTPALRSLKQIGERTWCEAIAAELLEMKFMIDNRQQAAARNQRDMICSQQWAELTKQFGYAEMTDKMDFEKITSKQLNEILHMKEE